MFYFGRKIKNKIKIDEYKASHGNKIQKFDIAEQFKLKPIG